MSKKLITEDYLRMNQQLHEDPGYGVGISEVVINSRLKIIGDVAREAKAKTILDYGCGKGVILEQAKQHFDQIEFYGYDPAVVKWSEEPPACDVVYSFSVLEHIEPELLDNVIDDILEKTKVAAILFVDTIPAIKSLPDGRNPHLTIEGPTWWRAKFKTRFRIFSEFEDSARYGAFMAPLR